MLDWLRHGRGAAATETAMVAPLLLLLLVGAAEFGAVGSLRQQVAAAARAGAEAAAAAVSADDLSAPGALARAESAARATVLSVAPGLPGLSVSVTWTGPVSSEVEEAPSYAMLVRVPVVENVEQVVDTSHDHRFSWLVPEFGPVLRYVASRFPAWWLDRTPVVSQQYAQFGDQHAYTDADTWLVNGVPQGTAVGLGQPLSLFIGYWASWASHPWISGVRDVVTDRLTAFSWARSSGTGGAALSWTDLLRSGWSDPVFVRDRRWAQSGTREVWAVSRVDGPILRFVYAVRRPDEEVTFRSLPAWRLRQTRSLEVRVSARYRSISGMLRPLLDGRTVQVSASSVAVSVLDLPAGP